ncbi:hypothetical protein [Runella sp.]|uniref:hypothetical protein n=1 Tax=Runella sp. TaxID=1960881 RepID=UPI003D0B820A
MRKPLTVLWFGGGQDSTAMLYMYVHDLKWREKYVGDNRFLVVMSDTGNEFPETYHHVASIKAFCELYDVEFYHLKPHMGYHPRTWPSLGSQMRRNDTIFSVGFPKSCTDNLKIKPCYNFLEGYLKKYYGYTSKRSKGVFYKYAAEFGKLTSFIGFAKGEESRCADSPQLELFPSSVKTKNYLPKYRRECVQHRYPLVEMRMSRADCQAYISAQALPVPIPPNCMMCPFQNDPEIVYLERFHPNDWQQWVKLEANKLAKNGSKTRNLGVKGEKTLPEFLENAKRKYGHWSDDQLREYRNSHGHCVKSKY